MPRQCAARRVEVPARVVAAPAGARVSRALIREVLVRLSSAAWWTVSRSPVCCYRVREGYDVLPGTLIEAWIAVALRGATPLTLPSAHGRS